MDVFDHMRAAADAGDSAQKQLSFQERIVKQLLRRANVQLNLGLTKRLAFDKYGTAELGFQWFNQEFPAFPVTLLAQKLKYTQQTMLADLYGRGRFKQLGWWKEYVSQVELYDINLQTHRAVLFFNLPYAKDAFLMALHNQPISGQTIVDAENRQDEPWPRTTFPMGKTGVVAVLESFDSFLQTVGTDWIDVT